MEKMEKEKNEVSTAFETLLKKIDRMVHHLKRDATKAFHSDDYKKAGQLSEHLDCLKEFREKVEGLQKEWTSLFDTRRRKRRKADRRKSSQHLSPGLRTPENAFRKPILEALVELGGRARAGEVLDLVGRKMSAILNKYDYQPLPSNSRTPRWRNTAWWCATLIRKNEKLMKDDSPRGIWEISDRGREWLEAESQ